MKAHAKTALGIDINDRRVSAALVEKHDQGFRVVAAASESLPGRGSETQTPAPTKALSCVLRKLGRRARSRAIRKAVAISAGSVIVRLLDLPRQMPTNVAEFVNNELRQYVALSGRRTSSDFCGIGFDGGARKRLLAGAADAAQIEEIIATCRAAGISVDFVEPAVVAYARAFRLSEKTSPQGGHTLVGVLGGRNLAVCVFSMGVPDFIRMREVPAGRDAPGLLSPWLAEELNAVLRYYRMNVPGGDSEWQLRLVVHDAGCSRDEIAPVLTQEPGMASLTVADCCERVGLPFGGAGAPASVVSAMAVGAALRLLDVEGDPLRIDLTPQEVIRARSSSRRVLLVANAAAVLFLASALSVQFLAKTADATSRRIGQRRVDEQLYAMSALVAKERYLHGEITQMQRQLAGLEAVRARLDVDWPAVLRAIGQATPAGSRVTQVLSVDGRSLSLTGAAGSPDAARTLLQGLDGTQLFESTRLTRLQRSPTSAEVIEYQIEGTLRSMNRENDSGSGS